MRIIHTSDWHIGHLFNGRKRYDEFEKFFNWMTNTINELKVEVLIVSGDIFDTTSPSNKAQEMYYNFLKSLTDTSCKMIVISGGNHDSPTFLDAPKEVLKHLNVFVNGSITQNIDDQIVNYKSEELELTICNVPYLRDRDLRSNEFGESDDEKGQKIVKGIKNHYQLIYNRAKELYPESKIFMTGHLFCLGGKILEGDGVRDIYVGSIAGFDSSIFPSEADYIALGHLHSSQKVGGNEKIRYSGSPLPMNFSESNIRKKILVIDINQEMTIDEISVPIFKEIHRLRGDITELISRLDSFGENDCFVEVEYTGDGSISDLRLALDKFSLDGKIDIVKIINKAFISDFNSNTLEFVSLEDITEEELFCRYIDETDMSEDRKAKMRVLFTDVVKAVNENDLNAE
ncbi:MAG: exonuclease SbcCD subunit D C-terminal domain-containing protein [Candidatus Delongbacteria bacterium]|nr:exonuclease SbcCD subunit D C-terminal domain-containing protein [Candidatus Delongbacteria bacterium]MBN2833521.1 exonuclease SbcCD subunit D C-terminal domain-containing protein [Candidatus Delongbacteria bacterium]